MNLLKIIKYIWIMIKQNYEKFKTFMPPHKKPWCFINMKLEIKKILQ